MGRSLPPVLSKGTCFCIPSLPPGPGSVTGGETCVLILRVWGSAAPPCV